MPTLRNNYKVDDDRLQTNHHVRLWDRERNHVEHLFTEGRHFSLNILQLQNVWIWDREKNCKLKSSGTMICVTLCLLFLVPAQSSSVLATACLAGQKLIEETSFISTGDVFWLVSVSQFGKDIFEPVAGHLKITLFLHYHTHTHSRHCHVLTCLR